MKRGHLLRLLFLMPALLVLGLAAGSVMQERLSPSSAASLGEGRPPTPPATGPLPRGRWRLAPRDELDHVVLFMSHILVRHADAVASDPPFAPPDWKVQPPLPSRNRDQASNLARRIAERALRDPSKFEELAREFSEDAITRDDGGSLGGVRATELAPYPQVLDALSTLRPGEVSSVVETAYGFHVFLRRPVPEAQDVAGRHIVIGHDAATWLEYRRRATKTTRRSREEALAFARRVAAEVRADPGAFGSVLAAYSEHADAELGGDLGVWSNREPTHFPRVVERLAAMNVGEITGPLETPLGFEILERTSAEAHPAPVLSAIRLAFDPAAPRTDERSLGKVMQRAEAILATLQTSPGRFEALQHELCCTGAERWRRGRGAPALTQVLDALPIGGIAQRPVVADHDVVITKRLGEDALPPEPAPVFELPSPATPDLTYLVSHAAASGLAAYTRSLADRERNALGLSGEQGERFVRLHDELAKIFETGSAEERLRGLEQSRAKLRELLGRTAFEAYASHVRTNLSTMLAQAP